MWFLLGNFSIAFYHWEKECSAEAVPTGIAKHTFARILKFGHIVSNIELVDNSFNCSSM